MNRRNFINLIPAVLAAASAPSIFVPQLIKPIWKRTCPIAPLMQRLSVFLRPDCHYWVEYVWDQAQRLYIRDQHSVKPVSNQDIPFGVHRCHFDHYVGPSHYIGTSATYCEQILIVGDPGVDEDAWQQISYSEFIQRS